MKILVTGCAGFIGSNLTDKLLEEGFHVVGIDNFDLFYARDTKEKNLQSALSNNRFQFFEGDISDEKIWNKIPLVDCVVHLAAKAGVRPSIENPLEYIQSNIVGTQMLVNWMVKNNIKNLAFASSSSVYGNNQKIPFAETDNVDFPISPYAYTKKACEELIFTHHHLYDLNALCLRFFTVYGPRQRPDLAIHKFTKLIFEDKPIPLFGDGSTARDYTYVSDTVDGILKSIDFLNNHTEKPIYEIINLGNNHPVSLKELIDEIEVATGKKIKKDWQPMQPGDVNITFADISKGAELLNYKPKVSIKEGLKNFVSWYESKN